MALLPHCLGVEGQRLFYTFATPDSATAASGDEAARNDEFDAAIAALGAHYKASTNVVIERHRFRQRVQLREESVDRLALRELSATCDFGSEVDDLIRDQIV